MLFHATPGVMAVSETATDGERVTASETDTKRETRRWWTIAIFAFIVLEGAAETIRGAVIPSLRATFPVPEWQLGLVAPAGTAGFLLVVMVMGAVAGRVKTRLVLLVGIGGTGFGLLVMGLAPSFLLFLGALLGRGVFVGISRGSDRPLLSHLYPARRGRLFGYYDMMWAVGATLGPLLVAGAVALGDWRLAYFVLGVAFVPVLALVWRLPTPDVGGDDPLDLAELRRIVRRPEVLVMVAGLFLSVGIEGGLFTWLTTFADGQLSDTLATASLSLMIVAYVPGRFVGGRLADRFGYLQFTIGLSLALLPIVWYTFFIADGRWLLAGFFALGFAISGYFPTFTAYATEAVPEHSAPINATALVASSAGLALVPAAMGFVIGDVGIERAMQLLLVPLGLLLVVVVVTWFRTERRR